jgi:hypothetical protein
VHPGDDAADRNAGEGERIRLRASASASLQRDCWP